jgi:hypothetical protein
MGGALRRGTGAIIIRYPSCVPLNSSLKRQAFVRTLLTSKTRQKQSLLLNSVWHRDVVLLTSLRGAETHVRAQISARDKIAISPA